MPESGLTADTLVVRMAKGTVTVSDSQAGRVTVTEARTHSLTINDSQQEA